MKLKDKINLDIYSEKMSLSLLREVRQLIDVALEAHQNGINFDLTELDEFQAEVMKLWGECEFYKSITPNHVPLLRNEKILVQVILSLWAASLKLKDFQLNPWLKMV
jgi:hypothetical protein